MNARASLRVSKGPRSDLKVKLGYSTWFDYVTAKIFQKSENMVDVIPIFEG